MDSLVNLNLYELIGAKPTATLQEIKKAYRKKALSCHPDKHPDNPRAAELFHELSRALEILTDISARAAYDKVLNARQQAILRTKELDVKRKKFKEDLEAREAAYMKTLEQQNTTSTNKHDEQVLQAEIERLQKEGSKQVEEEIAFVKKKIYEQLHGFQEKSNETAFDCRVKIKWKVVEDDPSNGGYDYETLLRILSKYGDITALIVSSTKKGRALVEFQNRNAAETATQVETGLVENPLILKGLWNKEETHVKNPAADKMHYSKNCDNSRVFPIHNTSNDNKTRMFPSFTSAPDIFMSRNNVSDAEFESSVLSNLRRAEERKRLIEQLKTDLGT